MDGGERHDRRTIRGRAMTNGKTLLIALAMAAAIGGQAHAGMSGTSERVQKLNTTEANAAVPPQAHAPAPPPQRRAAAKPERSERGARPAQASGGNFDGVWAVSSSSGCGLSERSAVEVRRGRISGQGVSGSIDAGGNVRTVGYGGGLSVISKGRAAGSSASGTYEVSNGCTGTWSASKV